MPNPPVVSAASARPVGHGELIRELLVRVGRGGQAEAVIAVDAQDVVADGQIEVSNGFEGEVVGAAGGAGDAGERLVALVKSPVSAGAGCCN